MGVAERKERHKEELKKEILMAATKLFMEQGYEATSIRNIAEKIEYSPATVYLYYRDKDEIMHAVHSEGFKMLVSHFAPLATIADPFERLKRLGQAYIQFCLENAEMYNLLFVMHDPMDHVTHCKEDWDEGDRAFDVLYNTVVDCQQKGYLHDIEPIGLSFMIWSTMHGLCTLRTSGHLGHVSCAKNLQPDVDSLMTYTYESFVKVLERLKK
ncbi:MAG TPA: TetR/AcrR family transcriptional regulator [Chryseosolibacter sp.]|nr:TetR/AcrR family transcriptional regulator [Chryseosolibacter sp.]